MIQNNDVSVIYWENRNNSWFSELSGFLQRISSYGGRAVYPNPQLENLFKSGVFVVHEGKTWDVTNDIEEAYSNGQQMSGNKEAQNRIKNMFRAEFPGFPLTPKERFQRNEAINAHRKALREAENNLAEDKEAPSA